MQTDSSLQFSLIKSLLLKTWESMFGYCSINVFISLIFKDAFGSSQNLMKINKHINSMTTEVFSEIFSPKHEVAGE